jgi:hypothetical protein
MATIEQIIGRFVRDAGTDEPHFLRPRSANVIVANDGRSLYSYGSHFTLARLMPATRDGWDRDDRFSAPDGWWLVNGDTYSVSTSRHQRAVRAAIRDDGRPMMIVSFTALASAGIDRETIAPIEALDDRSVTVTRSAASLDGVPEHVRREYVRTDYPDTCTVEGCDGTRWAPSTMPDGTPWMCSHRLDRNRPVYRDTPERWAHDEATGRYTWTESRHVLGESVFAANVETTTRDSEGRHVRMNYSATFLSAFDHQESHLHYFLAELPAGAHQYGQDTRGRRFRVQSVNDAFAALRPAEVIHADRNGTPVVRQGDMFAVARPDVTDAALKANGYVRSRMGRIDASSHLATEVAVSPDGSRTFARGILWHRPEGFRSPGTDPNHARQTMGDRRTWHLVVRNTVPRHVVGARAGDGRDTLEARRPRSWTRGGSID